MLAKLDFARGSVRMATPDNGNPVNVLDGHFAFGTRTQNIDYFFAFLVSERTAFFVFRAVRVVRVAEPTQPFLKFPN